MRNHKLFEIYSDVFATHYLIRFFLLLYRFVECRQIGRGVEGSFTKFLSFMSQSLSEGSKGSETLIADSRCLASN